MGGFPRREFTYRKSGQQSQFRYAIRKSDSDWSTIPHIAVSRTIPLQSKATRELIIDWLNRSGIGN